eukprot:scaffold202303_cov33-Prasinocladus_malaysianus.AAC.1
MTALGLITAFMAGGRILSGRRRGRLGGFHRRGHQPPRPHRPGPAAPGQARHAALCRRGRGPGGAPQSPRCERPIRHYTLTCIAPIVHYLAGWLVAAGRYSCSHKYGAVIYT